MSLVGKTTEEKIWNYLVEKLQNEYGAAGLMGNIYAESGLKSTNLQNSFEKKLGYTDETYTKAVDDGSYTNFVNDKAGYGLCQWTFWSRKQKLQTFAKQNKKSIGDLEMQLDYLMNELALAYPTVLTALKSTASVFDASTTVLLKFERPANQSVENQKKRASYGQDFYDRFAGAAPKTSGQDPTPAKPQINIIKKTSYHNTTKKIGRKIQWIVLHYTAGVSSKQGRAQGCAQGFATTTRQASADFIVDDVEKVQYNPDPANYYCWSVGGSKYAKVNTSLGAKYYGQCMNNNSISIEMCSNKKNTSTLSVADDDWYLTEATVQNAVELTKYLMQVYNIDINHVIMHHMVTGKICPQPWCKYEAALVNWHTFLQRVAGTPIPPVPTPITVNYSIRITASSLNVRKGPSTAYAIIDTLKQNTYVTIVEEDNGWGRIKDTQGWINLKYTVKEEPTFQSYKARVTANVLNVRTGPGINYPIVRSIKKNEVYTIVEEQNDWGKLKSGIGWVNLNYMQKI
jgi:uncharacterized protein YgiM (DUF1202 family)